MLMSAVETGQMSAAETGQMSAVETRQMYSIKTGQRPVAIVDICLVSTADICPVSAADICPVSTADICPVSTEDIWLLCGHLEMDENDFDPFFTPKMRKMEHRSRSSRRSWSPGNATTGGCMEPRFLTGPYEIASEPVLWLPAALGSS